jgi:hypothetical protein
MGIAKVVKVSLGCAAALGATWFMYESVLDLMQALDERDRKRRMLYKKDAVWAERESNRGLYDRTPH